MALWCCRCSTDAFGITVDAVVAMQLRWRLSKCCGSFTRAVVALVPFEAQHMSLWLTDDFGSSIFVMMAPQMW